MGFEDCDSLFRWLFQQLTCKETEYRRLCFDFWKSFLEKGKLLFKHSGIVKKSNRNTGMSKQRRLWIIDS